MRGRGDEGQATVELALVLPVVAVLALCLVQVGLLARDQVLVVHAARESARTAAVTDDAGQIRSAALRAGPLDAGRLVVTVRARGAPGATVTVSVDYDAPVVVPLASALRSQVHLTAEATMRVET